MTIDKHATAHDFDTWSLKAERMNIFGLHRAAEDAWSAAQCAAEIGNEIREGFYRDQAATYRAAARKRLVGEPQPTRAILVYSEETHGFVPGGTCTFLAQDGHDALVAPHDGTGRWTVLPVSMLAAA